MIENLKNHVRATLAADRKATRGFVALVEHYGLTHESDSKAITAAARDAILAAYPGTDPARLAGKDKADDQRWKDARAMRAGLVRAIEPSDDEPEPKPVALRVSLSGEGGGTTTVETTHPLYATLVALIKGE